MEVGTQMRIFIRITKITLITLISLFTLLVLGLFIYTKDSYSPSEDMIEEINQGSLEGLTLINAFDHISYKVEAPRKNIVIIPGGKVKPESYQYLALFFAYDGYDVTIVKTLFNLAILTPNYGARFLKDDMDNVVIGHSLGGTVGSMISSNDSRVSEIIFLASYPIADVSNKRVLIITAEFDLILDKNNIFDSESLLPEDYVLVDIPGGNHAQFGWYGVQKGDGEALIATKTQQNLIISEVLSFIM